MKPEKTNKSNQRREALNIHNPVQVERSDTQLVTDDAGRAYAEQGKTTAYCCCLLLLLLCPAVLSAQNDNGVTVGNLVVNTGSPTTVTFDVSWKNTGMPTVWSDTVWVFVDYNDNGTMKRLELSAGATLTATSAPDAGRVEQLAGNNTGVRVIGNARSAGIFSATVQLLTATTNVAGACAYAPNYPPVGEYTASNVIAFTGTPVYDLVLKHTDGSETYTQSDSPFFVPSSYTLLSFTDKTGAPGIIKCLPPVAPTVAEATFCFGFPGQLTASAPDGGTVKWYNATAGGDLLHTGNVFPLTPLYNASAQYYAESVSTGQCVSLTRTQAIYRVNNCAMGPDCPNYTAGSVGTGTPSLSACSVFYPGQIGVAGYRAACGTYSAGQIGRSQ